MLRLQRSIGRTVSRLPWAMKMRGLPDLSCGVAKLGEKARMARINAPLVRPSDRA